MDDLDYPHFRKPPDLTDFFPRDLDVKELVLKIAILAEKNAPNFGWYVDAPWLPWLAWLPWHGICPAEMPRGGLQDVGECTGRRRVLRS